MRTKREIFDARIPEGTKRVIQAYADQKGIGFQTALSEVIERGLQPILDELKSVEIVNRIQAKNRLSEALDSLSTANIQGAVQLVYLFATLPAEKQELAIGYINKLAGGKNVSS